MDGNFCASSATVSKTPKPFSASTTMVLVYLLKDPAWEDWSWFPRGGERDLNAKFRCSEPLEMISPSILFITPVIDLFMVTHATST